MKRIRGKKKGDGDGKKEKEKEIKSLREIKKRGN